MRSGPGGRAAPHRTTRRARTGVITHNENCGSPRWSLADGMPEKLMCECSGSETVDVMEKFQVRIFTLMLLLLTAAPGARNVLAAPAEVVPAAAPASVAIHEISDIVTEILTKNPELAFYRAEIAAARAGRQTAGQWANPEVTAELGSKRAWERGGGKTLGDGLAWSASVAQTFEYPGRIALRKAIANRQVELAELGQAQFEAALAARARALAVSALSAQQRADAAREVAARYRSVADALVQREAAGPTPVLEQKIIEAAALTVERRLIQVDREWREALLELNQLRGQPAHTALRLKGELAVRTNLPPIADLLEVAYQNNFELKMRQAELEQQGFRVQLARNERFPAVTLSPFYSSEKAADQERIVGVGLSVPLPILSSGRANIDAAEARLQQAEASWRAACRDVERRIAANLLALESLAPQLRLTSPERLQQFREAAELADRHFRLGAVPLTTYLEMQGGYLDALDALMATRQEALEHRQQLDVLVGRPCDPAGSAPQS